MGGELFLQIFLSAEECLNGLCFHCASVLLLAARASQYIVHVFPELPAVEAYPICYVVNWL